MARIQEANKFEWLSRGEMWYGIDSAGSIKNVYVDTLDFIKINSTNIRFCGCCSNSTYSKGNVRSSVKGANFMFNEDSGSEMCPKNTMGSMQKSRMGVKF